MFHGVSKGTAFIQTLWSVMLHLNHLRSWWPWKGRVQRNQYDQMEYDKSVSSGVVFKLWGPTYPAQEQKPPWIYTFNRIQPLMELHKPHIQLTKINCNTCWKINCERNKKPFSLVTCDNNSISLSTACILYKADRYRILVMIVFNLSLWNFS